MDDMTKTEQHLATLKTGFGEQNPDVQSAAALLKTLQKQIDDQEAGILLDLREKRDEARKAYDALPKPGGFNPFAGATEESAVSTVDAFEAAEVKRIAAMIKDSPDLINIPQNGGQNPFGQTPLLEAVDKGQLKVARYLIENHADPDLRDRNDKTPLQNAAERGNTEMVELLLSTADVNATSEGRLAEANHEAGYTALHYAARKGSKAIAETLLAHGAKVNAQSATGLTPLYIAAEEGFKTVAELLLAHGADLTLPNRAGLTPLHVAVRSGNRAITELLLANHADVNAKTVDGSSPLQEAASSGNKGLVEFLLAHQADVNNKAKDGMTPLLMAASNDHLDTARLLLRTRGGRECPNLQPSEHGE